MLTHLQVRGFKSLVDVDVYLGPFTCLAGPNASGKSNLFDAIRFLSALADRSLLEAALSVRDERGRSGEVRDLFHTGPDGTADRIELAVEMIVPREARDDLGQTARAGITFLRYELTLARSSVDENPDLGGLRILREALLPIKKGDARGHLRFAHRPAWRDSAVWGPGRRGGDFISTIGGEGDEAAVIRRHQEGSSGRPLQFAARHLPRTVLSSTNATESPTALLARREMQSWRLLQLDPAALRRPDPFNAAPRMDVDGSHLPAVLNRLLRAERRNGEEGGEDSAVCARIANRLATLLPEVRRVWIDRDERRELLTLMVEQHSGTEFPARALSDGTLRFLALSVLAEDPTSGSLLCLEEPENGIHPDRVPAMLELLHDLCTEVEDATDEDNPLRQVVVSTHSPGVVSQVADDELVLVEAAEFRRLDRPQSETELRVLPGTWRAGLAGQRLVDKGDLIAYLGGPRGWAAPSALPGNGRPRRRVAERRDLQLSLQYAPDGD